MKQEDGNRTITEQHSRVNAARMLADDNYPTEYEWILLHSIISSSTPVPRGDVVWATKMVTNLRAMLEEARSS